MKMLSLPILRFLITPMLSFNFISLSVALVCWLLLLGENMVVTSHLPMHYELLKYPSNTELSDRSMVHAWYLYEHSSGSHSARVVSFVVTNLVLPTGLV